MVQDLDIHYSRGPQPLNSIALKVKTQGTITKESKPEEFRPKKSKLVKDKNPAPPRFESTEPGKTFRIDKKGSILRRSGTGKTIPRQLWITPMPLRLVRRNWMIKAMRGVTIVRKSAIFQKTARNLQKTRVGLGNLRFDDW